MSMSLLATTPGNRLVMPRSSTAAGGLDALMAHSPGGKGLRRGGQASATLARQLPATRVELTHCYGSARSCRTPPRRAGVRREPSGHGVVLTLMVPSTIFFLAASSLGWMSLMKPPLVASETPLLDSE